MSATLNALTVLRATVQVPAGRLWFADVVCDDSDDAPAVGASAVLRILEVDFVGTVLSGATHGGKSLFRVVGGAGGWGKAVVPRDDANDASIKQRKIVEDLASAAGETLDVATLPPASATVGPHYTRIAQTAGSAMTLLLGADGWHVGLDGVTRVGLRPTVSYDGDAVRVSYDPAHARVELNPQTSIAGLQPGAVVDGTAIVDVEISMSPEGTRVVCWGDAQSAAGRRLSALAKLVRGCMPDLRYFAPYEYRVVSQDGERLNLQVVHSSTGMPDLARVPVRPGVPGARATHLPGSLVLVQFVDANPARPVVTSFDDASSVGFGADALYLAVEDDTIPAGSGTGRVLRIGDVVFMPTGAAAVPTGVVLAGAPAPGATVPGPFDASPVRA